jgi:DNA-binding Lrp family transcriptional regulator
MPKTDLSRTDLDILRVLQADGRISNVALAEAVNLSPSPCLRRVKRLERAGTIRTYVALVDQKQVDLPISVFVSVTLESQEKTALRAFETAIRDRPEVMECYLMTGDSDYLLRVVAADLDAYQRFLLDHLTLVPGVANIRSSFALQQLVYKTALPI